MLSKALVVWTVKQGFVVSLVLKVVNLPYSSSEDFLMAYERKQVHATSASFAREKQFLRSLHDLQGAWQLHGSKLPQLTQPQPTDHKKRNFVDACQCLHVLDSNFKWSLRFLLLDILGPQLVPAISLQGQDELVGGGLINCCSGPSLEDIEGVVQQHVHPNILQRKFGELPPAVFHLLHPSFLHQLCECKLFLRREAQQE